jgi:5-methylcytosine-specific restriction endonuclease McrA
MEGWLPPSLESRVANLQTWERRLAWFAPVESISMELVKFDTQALQNPEISGVEYQQGELMGYEIREYLLEKWGRKCAYCGRTEVPLEVEHIVPKSRGGSNRVSNLTLSCHKCNREKGSRTAKEFGHPEIQAVARQPLKDAAAVNTTRWELWRRLSESGLPVHCGTGGQNQIQPHSFWPSQGPLDRCGLRGGNGIHLYASHPDAILHPGNGAWLPPDVPDGQVRLSTHWLQRSPPGVRLQD